MGGPIFDRPSLYDLVAFKSYASYPQSYKSQVLSTLTLRSGTNNKFRVPLAYFDPKRL